jgi:hypothetical protein
MGTPFRSSYSNGKEMIKKWTGSYGISEMIRKWTGSTGISEMIRKKTGSTGVTYPAQKRVGLSIYSLRGAKITRFIRAIATCNTKCMIE